MIHNIIPPSNFFQTHSDFGTKILVKCFLTIVVKFGVSIPITLGEINGNGAWK